MLLFTQAPIIVITSYSIHYTKLYDTSSGIGWAPPILFIREVIGAERMMYAMDYPWQFVPDEVGWLDNLPLDDAGKKQFFEDNARRLFKIE